MEQKYVALNNHSVIEYVKTIPQLFAILGGEPYQALEVGDGNLNLVFIVQGANAGIVIKQALPYVRLVGEGWPLPISRSHFEHLALLEHANCAAQLVVEVFYHDSAMALTAMQWLSPHITLRKGLIKGEIYPNLGSDLGKFLALTLLKNSSYWLDAVEKKRKTAIFLENTAMCQITEDLVFDEPYFDAPMNRHSSFLNEIVEWLRSDQDLIIKVQQLKAKFVNEAETLLHGDLHTGSVMVTHSDTKVIDPEFAFYGPMGFDIGAILANFIMAFFAQKNYDPKRTEYRRWILEQTKQIWLSFELHFCSLWALRPEGAVFRRRVKDSQSSLEALLDKIWRDSLGFLGCEMIRRILGLAHVEDFETIADLERRADSEKLALLFARELIVNVSKFSSIDSVIETLENEL